ncbi:c3hc4 type (ring finger) zinc finger containing protein [Ophiostoma piceae UAMH 11346]|uniref:E3 ubiquitin-protein ligase listerin n=1 Tax=Ophiostoma piceae (strain UAMH 11346) TaxID=1262450 RepID=S3CJB6_OPHP1|nr:c3hc4 type (ring finger) zinc finger containing protein [Ophiostoma piceae UAMH 11346]
MFPNHRGPSRGPPPGGLRSAPTGFSPRGRAPRGNLSAASASLSPSSSTLSYLAEPINYQTFTDGNAAVAFKSVAKKDETTRARGLEDLVAFADANPNKATGGVEEAVLEAWSRSYPRLSIDESRKVRELAHTCQFAMMKSGRKRMERFIPTVIGPWLAGTYDRDTVVAKAARDGLSSFLTSDDKSIQFYKKLQPQILEYATAALNETPATLCDLRSVKQDVAEAKHARVQYSCLALVMLLFTKLSKDDTDTLAEEYKNFFNSKSVRSSMLSADHALRRISYELYLECLNTRPELIKASVPTLKKFIVEEVQKVGQYSSLVALVKLLHKIAQINPDVWAKDEVHPYVQLKLLLEKGSQNTLATSAHDFWAEFNKLASLFPARAISVEDASGVLTSFQRGLTARDEPRDNAIGGWTAYLSMANRLIGSITPEEARKGLIEAHVLPVFGHFLAPPSASVWDSSSHLPVITNAAFLVSRSAYPDIVGSARNKWAKLASEFSGRMANSLPEVSSNFKSSQEAIANEGERWFSLISSVHESAKKNPAGSQSTNLAEDVLEQPTITILQSAVDLLKKRNYKPFGAAQLLLSAFTRTSYILASDSGKAIVTSLLPLDSRDELALLISSPSAPTLLSCLRASADIAGLREHYQAVYSSIVSTLLDNASAANAVETAKSLAILVSDASDAAHATNRRNDDLQKYLCDSCLAVAQGKSESWDLFNAVFAAKELTLANTKELAKEIVDSITIENKANALSLITALEIIASRVPNWVGDDESLQLDLMSKLLVLVELNNNKKLSAKVLALREILDNNSRNGGGAETNTSNGNLSALLTIIQSNIDNTGPESLEVDTLIEQVKNIVKSDVTSDEDKENLLPDTGAWMTDLQAFLKLGLNASLSLTSALRGAYLLVPPTVNTDGGVNVKRDRHGNTKAARMASYTTKLLGIDGFSISSLPRELQVELLYALYLVSEIGSDQVALDSHDSLWGDLSASLSSENSGFALAAAEEQISSIQSLLSSIVTALSEETTQALIELMLQQTGQLTPIAVYSARALSLVIQTRSSQSGIPSEAYLSKLNLWKVGSSETALGAVAFLAGYGDLLESSKTINTFVNRLVSEVSGLSLDPAKYEKTLTTLVVLNAALGIYEVGQVPAANNRLVFAVKHLTSWFSKETDGENEDGEDAASGESPKSSKMNTRIIAESCWALSRLMPCIKDIYGPHWERAIRFCINLWGVASTVAPENDAPLAYLHASLKLVGTIKTASEDEEASDDLADSMILFGDALWAAARKLLLARAHFPELILARPQPHQIVDDALSRMASQTPVGRLTKTAPYFTMVSSDSRGIQAAGYDFLHRAIPAEQAELSLDTILEKKVAKLPDSLLGLLVETPTLEAYPDDILATFPMRLRTYLLGWKLVFDAFSTASSKVRGDYADQLANAQLLPGLMEFTVDVLGHSVGQPLNLDREGLGEPSEIVEYSLSVADSEADERHLHRLLVHVYFLSLKFLPGVFKAWFMTCRSKQTTKALNSWTAKYFSPMLIEAALDSVAKWSDEQVEAGNGGDDDREMTVSVRKKVRQVVASYEMDETTMSITLQVPENYPIDKVECLGTNRMLVSEEKWTIWMRITEGVIAFSNGSLVDGLTAFRRNVSSTLKGQTECAICYCFISEDKKIPETRCSTCKHLFHKLCLYKWLSTSSQNTCPLCRNLIGLHYGSKTRRTEPIHP